MDMKQILCSTGALLGRPNGRDYHKLGEVAKKLNCDGLEFMVYGSWYPEFDELLETVKGFELNIPVLHCQKALGETLCGMTTTTNPDWSVTEHEMSPEEDAATFAKGIEEFKLNLKAAKTFGSEKMVLHLWNGTPSDRRIERNIARLDVLKKMAEAEGILLMVENVICNQKDPLTNLKLVHEAYPDATFVYDTKMAEFHGQTMKVFEPEYEWLFKDHFVKHLHVNDYAGGVMDWANLNVLPIGKGHVDFDGFFEKVSHFGYTGDFTVEATGFSKESGGAVDCDMLNKCFDDLRALVSRYL